MAPSAGTAPRFYWRYLVSPLLGVLAGIVTVWSTTGLQPISLSPLLTSDIFHLACPPVAAVTGSTQHQPPRAPAAVTQPLPDAGPFSCSTLESQGRYSEVPLTDLLPMPRVYPGNLSRFAFAGGPSSLAHLHPTTCPMYVTPPTLPPTTPMEERLLHWAMAYSTALNFGATFLHKPLDGAGGMEYNSGTGATGVFDGPPPPKGWDTALGLGLDELTSPLTNMSAVVGPSITLASWGGVKYDEDVFRRGDWWGKFNDPANCGATFTLPVDGRAWDFLWLSRTAAAQKWAKARRREEEDRPLGQAALLWESDKASGDQQTADPPPVIVVVHLERLWVKAGEEGGRRAGGIVEGLWDAPETLWVDGGGGNGGEGRWWYPTKEGVSARIIRSTVLPSLQRAGMESGVEVHVFTGWKEGKEAVEDLFPDLLSLASSKHLGGEEGSGKGVTVAFHNGGGKEGGGFGGWEAFRHMVQGDVLVGSASLWSMWAAHFAHRPYILAQEDSDRVRVCGEGAACCFRDGQCPFHGEAKMAEVARRMRAREVCRRG